MADKKNKHTEYYKLDTGGVIYPYIAKSDWNQVFRLEAELDEDVDVQCVVKALENLKKQFPSFFVNIEKRKLLYLLKKTDKLPQIEPEKELCRQFDLLNSEYPLFRITYKGSRLGIELFHSVSDGNGAVIFFINVLAEYYSVKGMHIKKTDKIFEHGFSYEKSDTENSFLRVFEQGGSSSSRSEKPAYQYNGGKADCDLRLTTFKIPLDSLKKAAAKNSATVTVFLAAVYTKALCKCAVEEASDNNVKIEVPLDLRRRFDSVTLRNFSLYFITNVLPEYASRDLADIIEVLKPQFESGADTKKLRNDVYTNVKQSEMPLFKGMPVFMKKAILKLGSSVYGERLFTTPLSNIGVIKLPEEIEDKIKSFGMIIGKTLKNTIYSGVVTLNGNVYWNLSSVALNKQVEHNIIHILNKAGVAFETKER